MTLLYIFGEPGVGKSTLTQRLLRHTTRGTPVHYTRPIPCTVWPNHVLHIGNPHPKNPQHPGTDTLPYTALPTARTWITTIPPHILTIAEGDRLANTTFWDIAHNYGHPLILIHLTNPTAAAHQRTQRGTKQNPTWLQGRQTKTHNLAQYPGVHTHDPHHPDTWPAILNHIKEAHRARIHP